MKISLICFTRSGVQICLKLMEGLLASGHECKGYGPDREQLLLMGESLSEWTSNAFKDRDAIVFIGAAGIAVRAIAPFLQGKDKDPAVVVLDDMGRFSISLLSGHLGGANELAHVLAQMTGGQAVITTATDNHEKFAVDMFAKEQGLVISDMKKIKVVSSAVLSGEPVGFFSDFPVKGSLPLSLLQGKKGVANIRVTITDSEDLAEPAGALRLVPRILVLGIGCRKGVPAGKIKKTVLDVLQKMDLNPDAILACASIDIKKEEVGICEFVSERKLPYYTYPVETLAGAKGEFSGSSFVKSVTGVDNVCERAAVICVKELGGGKLLVKKQASDGVTIAVAVRDWQVKL